MYCITVFCEGQYKIMNLHKKLLTNYANAYIMQLEIMQMHKSGGKICTKI